VVVEEYGILEDELLIRSKEYLNGGERTMAMIFDFV
jgi:hypothetical protein